MPLLIGSRGVEGRLMPSLIGSRWVEGRLANVCVDFSAHCNAADGLERSAVPLLQGWWGNKPEDMRCGEQLSTNDSCSPVAPRKRNRPACLSYLQVRLKNSRAHTPDRIRMLCFRRLGKLPFREWIPCWKSLLWTRVRRRREARRLRISRSPSVWCRGAMHNAAYEAA